MPNSTGNPLPLNYGYVWLTGQKLGGTTDQDTSNSSTLWTRTAGWLLGEGEMDGCESLWDSGVERLLYTSEFDDPSSFHFHRGCDAVAGSGLSPSSTGPDQGVDSFFQYLPSGIQPLTYNRMAHYWLRLKLKVNNPENSDQKNPNNYTDLSPIGLWRGLRVRLFDSTGAMTGYGFTTNPTWCMVDLILRRKLFVEYALDINNGPDDLTAAVRARFDWAALADHAKACDVVMPSGHRQYECNIAITQQGTMQSVLSPMLQGCRSYFQERNGLLSFRHDEARPSVFTLSRRNTLRFTADDKDLHSAPNRIVGQYRDIEIPVCATIASISLPDHGEPTVTTTQPHPCAAGDYLVIGGTNTTYDAQWVVDTVPAGDSVTTMTLKTRGSNYPASVGSGGKIGLLYSRFKQRSPEFNHHRNQYAKGAVGVGIPRGRNKVKQQLDFATCNYDQVSRVCRYERDRALGIDQVPYVTPVVATAVLDLSAADAAGSGNMAMGIDPGDRVTVDNTLTYTMPGDYEVLDVDFQPDTVQAGQNGLLAGSANAGSLTLKLGPYNESLFYNTSDPTASGWQTVPGSAPGNSTSFTEIPLADGSVYVFSGVYTNEQVLPLPAVGLSPADCLAAVSPAGHIDGNQHLHFIQLCDVDSNRKASMVWSSDVGVTWTGDVTGMGVAWRSQSSATRLNTGSMSFVQFTLPNGELVLFGRGTVADSAQVPLPSGYTWDKAVVLGLMRDGTNTDNPAHGCRAYVDTGGVAHMDYQDGENNVWHGNATVFLFAFQNNAGTWSMSNGWLRSLLATGGKTLAVGGFSILDASAGGSAPANFPSTRLQTVTDGRLRTPGDIPASSLQVLTGVNSFQITGNDAHGVSDCYVDNYLNSLATFEDGEGNVWPGSAGVLALLCDTADGSYSGGSAPSVTPGAQAGPTFAITGGYASSARPGASTTLSVNVRPASNSTGLSVKVDLSSIGGSSTHTMPAGQSQYSYTAFVETIAIPSGQAFGTYSLPVKATDQQGNTDSATISLSVTNQQTDAQLQLITTNQGDHTTTNGWQIINGGEGYTQYSTLTITGQDGQSPYGNKTVYCTLSLDANGAITAVGGGNGESWYGPPDYDLER